MWHCSHCELGVAAAQGKLGRLVVVKADRRPSSWERGRSRNWCRSGLRACPAGGDRRCTSWADPCIARPHGISRTRLRRARRPEGTSSCCDRTASRDARPPRCDSRRTSRPTDPCADRLSCDSRSSARRPHGISLFFAWQPSQLALLWAPHQREVGERMVEGFAVELDDVERAPFVLGVTRHALTLRRFGVAAMEAALRSADRRRSPCGTPGKARFAIDAKRARDSCCSPSPAVRAR